jgi:hypothetical protein
LGAAQALNFYFYFQHTKRAWDRGIAASEENKHLAHNHFIPGPKGFRQVKRGSRQND